MIKAKLIPSLACFAMLASCGGDASAPPIAEGESTANDTVINADDDVSFKPEPLDPARSGLNSGYTTRGASSGADKLRFSNNCPDKTKKFCVQP